MKSIIRIALLGAVAISLSGCIAVTAASTAVGVTGAVVGGTVKATGALVGAVIPDGDKGDED